MSEPFRCCRVPSRAILGLAELVPVLLCLALGGCTGPAACGDCYTDGFRVDLSSVPSETAPPQAVLFSGWRNGWCQEDLICTGAPDVFLGELTRGPLPWHLACDGDDQELIAFAGGHAPTPSTFDPSAAGVAINLASAAQVHVAVWIVGSAAITPEQARDDLEKTRGLLAGLGTGIDLVTTTVTSFPGLAAIPGLEDDASCELAGAIASSDAGGYKSDHINIYYVAGFAVTEVNPAAETCWAAPPSPSYPNIILVRGTLSYSPVALAHEVGHALGLVRSAPIPGSDATTRPGHVNELYLDPYLAESNLMRSASEYVGQATVGQIYRMHFDKLSWLWHNREPEQYYPRECQSSAAEGGACPPLTLQPPRGWP